MVISKAFSASDKIYSNHSRKRARDNDDGLVSNITPVAPTTGTSRFGCKSHRKSDGRQKRLKGDRPYQLPNYFDDVTILIILYTRQDDDAWRQTLLRRSVIRLRR